MKKITILFVLALVGTATYAQESTLVVSQLNVTPLKFNDAKEITELDVNFKIADPSKLSSVEITLASDMRKSNKVTITLTDQEFNIWSRGDLKVAICRVDVPSSLIGNCHYVEVKAIDTAGESTLLEGYPF